MSFFSAILKDIGIINGRQDMDKEQRTAAVASKIAANWFTQIGRLINKAQKDNIKYVIDPSEDGRLVATMDFADVKAEEKGGFLKGDAHLENTPDSRSWIYDDAELGGSTSSMKNGAILCDTSKAVDSVLDGNVTVMNNAYIENSTLAGKQMIGVFGTAQIKDNSTLNDGAIVGGSCIIEKTSIDNARIEGSVHIKDSKISSQESKINASGEISNCKINGLAATGKLQVSDSYMTTAKLSGEPDIKNSKIIESQIDGNGKIEETLIKKCTIGGEYQIINNSSVIGTYVDGNPTIDNSHIANSSIDGGTKITNSRIAKSEIEGNGAITGSTMKDASIGGDCTITNTSVIGASIDGNGIKLEDCTITGEINANDITLNNCMIEGKILGGPITDNGKNFLEKNKVVRNQTEWNKNATTT